MSATTQITQQLQQEIQYELVTANQLLQQISAELRIIEQFTTPGGEFETNVMENASLMSTLAKLQKVDLNNIPPFLRRHIDLQHNGNHTEVETTMDESQ